MHANILYFTFSYPAYEEWNNWKTDDLHPRAMSIVHSIQNILLLNSDECGAWLNFLLFINLLQEMKEKMTTQRNKRWFNFFFLVFFDKDDKIRIRNTPYGLAQPVNCETQFFA